jgi:hypothetical protein
MLRHILHITGLEQKLQGLKDRIEGRANRLILRSKAAAAQLAMVAALVALATVIVLMSFVAALAAFYLWLAPQIGSLAAIGIIAGGLLVIGAALAIAALIVARKELPTINDTAGVEALASGNAPYSTMSSAPAPSATPPISPQDVESLFAVAGQFAHLPQTGIVPVDNVLRAFAPKAEEATREAVARAANLVRHGDRTTMMSILGATVAVGWLLTKAADRPALKRS